MYADDGTFLMGECDPDAAGCNAGGACDRQDLTGTGSGYQDATENPLMKHVAYWYY